MLLLNMIAPSINKVMTLLSRKVALMFFNRLCTRISRLFLHCHHPLLIPTASGLKSARYLLGPLPPVNALREAVLLNPV